MDWKAHFVALYTIIDPKRVFPADFDFEANVDQLMADARAIAKTDVKVENEQLKMDLAAISDVYAAEQAALAAGLPQETIDKLKHS